ncbi:hypothetical protein HNQ91_003426 [Filimonas zeae]|nr:hypothetical protein [Filimonas zeae]
MNEVWLNNCRFANGFRQRINWLHSGVLLMLIYRIRITLLFYILGGAVDYTNLDTDNETIS